MLWRCTDRLDAGARSNTQYQLIRISPQLDRGATTEEMTRRGR